MADLSPRPDALAAAAASTSSTSSTSVAESSTSSAFYTPAFPSILMQPLLDMGFPEARAIRGLHATGGSNVDAAMNWIFEHSEDPDIDQPLCLARASPNAAATSSNTSANSSASSSAAPTSLVGPFKLVLLVRTDLRMRTGKIAAQTAHAAVGLVLSIQASGNRMERARLKEWLKEGQAKVVLAIKDEREMEQLEADARHRGLTTFIVADAGRTQVESGTETVLAIGPAPIGEIDEVTGRLKLL